MNHDATDSTQAQQASVRRFRRRAVAVGVLVVAVLGVALVVSLSSVATTSSPSGTSSVTVITTATAGNGGSSPDQVTPARMNGYHIVFDDEFNGHSVDTSKWISSLPWGNTNRGEQQYYVPSARSISDGILTITARHQNRGGKPYTSGIISTMNSFQFRYGYAEMRGQVPVGSGLWSAFWLLTAVHGSNNEIDAMEVIGADPNRGYTVLHYGTTQKRGRSISSYVGPDLSAGYHTFAVDWEPDLMVWFVDGVERYRVTSNIPTDPMYVLANLSVGEVGSWSGAPDRNTQFPAQFKIDYIRVYQRN